MNGGNPGIQTWTAKYQQTLRVLYLLMQSPNFEAEVRLSKLDYYFKELVELGVLSEEGPITKLHPDKLRKHSFVVNDELYENMTDLNWMREQRKKLGLIEGRLKDEAFRKRQQARRKKRRAYAKEQANKLKNQPREELPLSEVIFYDSSTNSEEDS